MTASDLPVIVLLSAAECTFCFVHRATQGRLVSFEDAASGAAVVGGRAAVFEPPHKAMWTEPVVAALLLGERRPAAAPRRAAPRARVFDIHFEGLDAARISEVFEFSLAADGRVAARRAAAAEVPPPAVLVTYAVKYPIVVFVGAADWARAVAMRPGALCPGSLKAFAHGKVTVLSGYDAHAAPVYALEARETGETQLEAAADFVERGGVVAAPGVGSAFAAPQHDSRIARWQKGGFGSTRFVP
jgi:hypothetical protein